MEEQVPPSNAPGFQVPQINAPGLDQIAEMKRLAMEQAIRQYEAQRAGLEASPGAAPERIVYVKRNLTVAELILIFALATGIVTAFQAGWTFVSNNLPRIEIRTVK